LISVKAAAMARVKRSSRPSNQDGPGNQNLEMALGCQQALPIGERVLAHAR